MRCRHERGTGEIGWDLSSAASTSSAMPWIGCKYNPVGDTVAGLAWRRRYGV